MFQYFLTILFIVFFQFLSLAQSNLSRKAENYIITNISIIDVENGNVQKDKKVEIRNGIIHRVISNDEKLELTDAEVINGNGLFLIPGLIDAHVHYFDWKVYGPMMIAWGVLFARDMGNTTNEAIVLREKLKNNEILGPEIITTGSILDGDPLHISQISISCGTPEAGKNAVRKQVAEGVNQIKVYSGLKKDVFLAIVDEAAKLGIKPVGHVPESIYIEDAAKAGLKSAEHLFGFGKIIGKLLGDHINFDVTGIGTDAPYFLRLNEVKKEEFREVLKGIGATKMHVCPTLVVFKHGAHLKEIFSGNYPMLEYTSPMTKSLWKDIWGSQPDNNIAPMLLPAMKEVIKELYMSGVRLMVGTDLLSPGVIPGYSVHEEMELWQEAGIPPAEILRSTTIVPAKFMGMDERIGSVSEGKMASLILLRSNPLEDIRNTNQIEGVFYHGSYFNKADLDKLQLDVKKICTPIN